MLGFLLLVLEYLLLVIGIGLLFWFVAVLVEYMER